MRIHFDSWCALSPRWRCLCWGVSSGLMLLCVAGGQLRLQYQQLATQRAQHVQDAQNNARLWAAVRKLSPADDAPSTVAPRPFSPLEFDTGELRMVRWQPMSTGGELVVEAVWAQIPALFVTLARRDVVVGRFTLQPEQQRLRLTLQLERRNAG
ncbi:HofO [Leclercia adecarboxylata]|uniref:HofO family protein n=1 Tax=Leclercia adecarboxylata TaxID=83655 RepID=UPI002DB7B345|nr:HofO [Leclercia adecarboxylata]MEB6381237.1 HofO [Leclercia adecarboxylata]